METTFQACPYEVVEACRRCWNNNKTVRKKQNASDHCWQNHDLSRNVVYISMPEKIEIRAVPTRFLSRRFEMCRNIQRTSYCTYYPRCHFAHSEKELEVWTWMAEYQGNNFYQFGLQLKAKLLICVATSIRIVFLWAQALWVQWVTPACESRGLSLSDWYLL